MLQETLPACCLQFSRGIGKPPLARAQPDFRRHEGTGNNLRPLLPPATHSARARRSLLSKVGQKSIPRKTRGVILYEGRSADTSCKMVRFEICTHRKRELKDRSTQAAVTSVCKTLEENLWVIIILLLWGFLGTFTLLAALGYDNNNLSKIQSLRTLFC